MCESDDAARILVVDDNADNRDMLARRLQRLGYATSLAEDGVAALEALQAAATANSPFDAVMLDVMMPRMNGVEVLEAMKASGSLSTTRVIMISAASEIATVVRCIELGAEDYLPKPFNPVLLRARLTAVLEKKRLSDMLARHLARVEGELAEARAQQLSMMPGEFPHSVHAVMHPAREVGGDLYDCFECGSGTLCLAIGDVSDKGVSAALFMARARSLLRAAALQHLELSGAPPPPSRLAAVMNDELCKNNPGGMFITLIVGFLNLAAGRFTFVNAGHPRPFRLGQDGSVTEVVTVPSPPLGVAPSARHADHTLVLEHGVALVTMTDGVADMLSPCGKAYGAAQVVTDLRDLAAAAPDVITTTLAAKVRLFADTQPAADDVTILAVRRG
jgi:serine phosphatase RsbU (regulator of sigma subunit)